MTQLKAGAGKREIVIPEGYPAYEHFGKVHDPIHARALAVEGDVPFVLVSLELTSLPGEEVAAMRKRVGETIGVDAGNVWIATTHSFSSPHLMPDHILKSEEAIQLKNAYRENLLTAVAEAAKKAWNTRREAVFGWGRDVAPIVANRDIELPDGWWIGTNGTGLRDETVTVLRFDGTDGTPIATIVHFGMQSSVMDQSESTEGGKIITADVAGMTSTELEARLGGTALYLIGAAGDQAPVEKAVTETFANGGKVRSDLHEEGLVICARLARQLADDAERAYRSIALKSDVEVKLSTKEATVPAKHMNGDVHSLRPTRHAVYVSDGERTQAVDAAAIGDVALLGVQPELNCVTGKMIASDAKYPCTLVCTMVNGACKYMADEQSYDTYRYEALNSPWDRGAAETIAEAGVQCIDQMKEGAK